VTTTGAGVTEPAVSRGAGSTEPERDVRGRSAAIALGVATFSAGGVTLGVEIAASRVLSPYFGSSLYVWGSLIGVVLSGLALGYWAGGALADRRPSPVALVGTLLLGGALVLLLPLVDDRVLETIVGWDPGPRANPLLASIALFFPPSFVLAGVTPIAVRLVASSVASVGATAGRLFALSTAGSIAGTFATAFFLVPELGTDQLLACCAAALFLAAVPVAAQARLVLPAAAALAAAGAAVALSGYVAPDSGSVSAASLSNWSPVYRSRADLYRNPSEPVLSGFKVVYRKDTRYHHLLVVDDAETRFLRFDNSFQSGMYLADPNRTRFEYTDYFQLGLAYDPGAKSVLFVGLGGGSAPKRFARDRPDLDLQVVEIDPDVVDVARRYFHVPETIPVAVEDGRRWLERHDRRFDVIAIDAYYSDAVPFHMTTREFVELVRSRLAPGGVVVVNVIGSLRGEGSQFLRSIYRTYRSVFPTVALHPVYTSDRGRDPTTIRNVALVATESAAPDQGFLAERWRAERKRHAGLADLGPAIRDRYAQTVPVDDVPTLTDDYAPTDALISGF
jgi:spermidine synthase